jgi:Prenyltransferase and squalene oxidase repeat
VGLKAIVALAVVSLVTVSDNAASARTQAFFGARDTFVSVSDTGVRTPVGFLQGRQAPSGAFSEPGGAPGPLLTAWAALGLRAAGADTGRAIDYLVAHEGGLTEATDIELVALAESALGRRPERLITRIRGLQRSKGRIGPTVNSTIWGILALRQSGERAPWPAVRFVLRRQARSGGWGWFAGGAPDSNDTAAAVEALRAAGVTGAPIRRGLAYLRRLQNRDGGFELTPGRGSDAQSTAWAVQAFVAARRPPSKRALAYLRRLRRPDGSFRYSRRYATTPVWVTAQVLPALVGRAFPLR